MQPHTDKAITTALHNARSAIEQIELNATAADSEETRRRLTVAAQQLRQASRALCTGLFGDTDRDTTDCLLQRAVAALPQAPDGSLQLSA